MNNQSINVNKFIIISYLLLNLFCAPTKLNSTCDPESKSFVITALLEFGSNDGSFLCPIFSGLSPLRFHYGTDFLIIQQNETINPITPFSTEPIVHCESNPTLPQGLILDESNCTISGTSLVGIDSTKYHITAKSSNKQTTIPLVIKSLFIPKFAYVANIGSNLINSYTINANSGVLNNTGFVAAGGGPESMAISPNQRFLTVANRNTNNLSQFSINQTNGNLTLVETVPSGGNTPISISYHPKKDLLYVGNSNNYSTFSVNSLTGNLLLVNTLAHSNASGSIIVEPFGNFFYRSNYNGNSIESFPIDINTGFLSQNPIQSIGSGFRPRRLAFHTNGNTLYVAYETHSSISTYQIDSNTGFMSSIFPEMPSTGVVTGSIVTDPKGRFFYIANRDTNTISMFATNPVTGELFPLSPTTIATGTEPLGITVDPSGKFLYNTNIAIATAGIFTINQSNGLLTPNGNVGTSTSPAVILTSGTNP